MKNHSFNRLLWGFGFIVIGVLFLLHQLDKISIDMSFIISLWPLIIIYYCFKGLVLKRSYISGWSGPVIWNVVGLCIGIYFLGRNFDYIDLSIGELFPYIIPIILILFGIHMILKPRKEKKEFNTYDIPDIDGLEDIPEILDADESTNHGEHFQHDWHKDSDTINKSSFIGDVYMGQELWTLQPLNISHFIGDTVIDLTKAQIPYGETKITVSAFIGDVKIFVPNDIELEVSVISSSFLGDSNVFDRKEGGMFNNMKIEPRDYQIADKRIRIIVSMFIGDIRVQRIG